MARQRVRFWIDQSTPSFPNGAPDRAEYLTDRSHEHACERYSEEWDEIYECTGCDPDTSQSADCPQCGVR